MSDQRVYLYGSDQKLRDLLNLIQEDEVGAICNKVSMHVCYVEVLLNHVVVYSHYTSTLDGKSKMETRNKIEKIQHQTNHLNHVIVYSHYTSSNY